MKIVPSQVIAPALSLLDGALLVVFERSVGVAVPTEKLDRVLLPLRMSGFGLRHSLQLCYPAYLTCFGGYCTSTTKHIRWHWGRHLSMQQSLCRLRGQGFVFCGFLFIKKNFAILEILGNSTNSGNSASVIRHRLFKHQHPHPPTHKICHHAFGKSRYSEGRRETFFYGRSASWKTIFFAAQFFCGFEKRKEKKRRERLRWLE